VFGRSPRVVTRRIAGLTDGLGDR